MSNDPSHLDAAGPAVAPLEPQVKPRPQKLPPYRVVLIDDDEHTYAYVVEMLGRLFRFGQGQAYVMARRVDSAGRVVLLTTTKEHAELKQQQIHAFGPDWRIERCQGSMRAAIEPAE